MSAYLTRLKQLESGENIQDTPTVSNPQTPQKPPKAPFDGFAGSHPGHIENIFANTTALPEHELRRLVRLVSDHHGFTQGDYNEALEIALGDQVSALTCFSALARQAGLI